MTSGHTEPRSGTVSGGGGWGVNIGRRALERIQHARRADDEDRSARTAAAEIASQRDHLPDDPEVAIPVPVRIAAAWSWRLLLIAAAVVALAYGLTKLSELVIPILVALLLTALLGSLVNLLGRWMHRGPATALVMVLALVLIAGALTIVIQQISTTSGQMVTQVRAGIEQIHTWLVNGPLGVSDAQITSLYDKLRESISTSGSSITSGALAVGTTAGHVAAGVALALFTTFFFLYQGNVIWSWFVSLFPRRARGGIDSSGRRGWISLTSYVRATILVAFTDALGITIVALILRVPLPLAIGVLVFLSAFIPIVGALISGVVAVLLALVAHGPIVALIMIGGVIVVQQVESHILQPFLMGRLVRLHPLGILFSIAAGGLLGGLVGALFAVPTAAFANAVVHHISSGRATSPAASPAGESSTEASPDGEVVTDRGRDPDSDTLDDQPGGPPVVSSTSHTQGPDGASGASDS